MVTHSKTDKTKIKITNTFQVKSEKNIFHAIFRIKNSNFFIFQRDEMLIFNAIFTEPLESAWQHDVSCPKIQIQKIDILG